MDPARQAVGGPITGLSTWAILGAAPLATLVINEVQIASSSALQSPGGPSRHEGDFVEIYALSQGSLEGTLDGLAAGPATDIVVSPLGAVDPSVVQAMDLEPFLTNRLEVGEGDGQLVCDTHGVLALPDGEEEPPPHPEPEIDPQTGLAIGVLIVEDALEEAPEVPPTTLAVGERGTAGRPWRPTPFRTPTTSRSPALPRRGRGT